ncbi:MAG: hypothetical protein ACC657_17490, partial [Thiohalomonadales bacterium]
SLLHKRTKMRTAAEHNVRKLKVPMNDSNNLYAVTKLYDWFEVNKKLFISNGAELEFKDSGQGSAYVRLETQEYMYEVIVWDHASCLNSQILEVKSEQSTFLHEGSCDSIESFKEYLNDFISYFNKNEK